MRFWILALLVACAHEPIESHDPVPRPAAKPREVAAPRTLSATAAKLVQVDRFALGGVGYAGAPNSGETLTREIAAEPDAIAVFTELATHPNRVTRLYAYWALRTLEPQRAETVKAVLAADRTMVQLMSGCVGYEERTQDALSYIEQRDRM
jgi:hypothetical protein